MRRTPTPRPRADSARKWARDAVIPLAGVIVQLVVSCRRS